VRRARSGTPVWSGPRPCPTAGPDPSRPVPDRRQVDDYRDVAVAASGVPPHMLVHTDHRDAVEPRRVGDEDPAALGQDRVVRRAPRHGEGFGDPGDGEVLDHQGLQRPPQRPPRQLRPGVGRGAGVLAPHVPAPRAPVAAHRDQQRRRPPPQRLVRELPQHRVTRAANTPAAAAPRVGFDDTAGQHRTVRLQTLPRGLQTELVEAAERGQVGAGEGSVTHVEVSWMAGVGTAIVGRPRPPPGDDSPEITSP
jgi:hypothetical protein